MQNEEITVFGQYSIKDSLNLLMLFRSFGFSTCAEYEDQLKHNNNYYDIFSFDNTLLEVSENVSGWYNVDKDFISLSNMIKCCLKNIK